MGETQNAITNITEGVVISKNSKPDCNTKIGMDRNGRNGGQPRVTIPTNGGGDMGSARDAPHICKVKENGGGNAEKWARKK
jgi:hypothetical protein